MNIYDVLDSATVVAADLMEGRIITWNDSATFNVYLDISGGAGSAFSEVDCFTRYGIETVEQAKAEAAEWIEENRWDD